MEETHICKNCGAAFSGKFCNQCGEKAYHEQDKSIHHLLHEATHFITHLDGAFFKTVKAVFTRPGLLSYDYVSGVRKKYFKPMSLFLICVVTYLLFPFFSGLNMKFNSYMNDGFRFHHLAESAALKKSAREGITLEELAVKYNAQSSKVSKLLLLLYLPLPAIVLALLFFRRKKFFFDHFILSAELNSFLVAFGFLLLPLLLWLIYLLGSRKDKGFQFFINDFTAGLIIGSAFLLVILFAFKRFYRENWLRTTIKSLLFLATFIYIIIPIYNIILFYTTLVFI